jgi:hypothetical protein
MTKKLSEPNLDKDAYDLKGIKHYFKSGGGGFMYEDSIFERCKELGLVPKTFTPAGSANNLPDILLSVAPGQSTKKQDIKIEIKLNDKADFGQSGLKCKSNGEWFLDGQKSPEAEQMRKLLNAMGVPKIVKKIWGPFGVPRKFSVKDGGTKKMNERDINYDREHFKDIMLTGSDAPKIETLFRYYGTKKTYYIQIGGKGLFFMQNDPANLKSIGVKKFDGTLKLRIRRKAGGSINEKWNYRFSTALLIDKSPSNSGFSLDSSQSEEDLLYYLDPNSIVSNK